MIIVDEFYIEESVIREAILADIERLTKEVYGGGTFYGQRIADGAGKQRGDGLESNETPSQG